MPLLTLGEASCYYRLDGAPERPVLVLSHSLGLDHGMWDAQAADLLPYFRVLRYDTRGHGASSAPAGDYSIAELGRDVLAIADACNVTRFAFCGLSLGGMIGQWLAVNAPERVTHLVLANTTSRLTDPQPMEARRRAVLEKGMSAIEDLVMGRFFSPAVLASPSPHVATARRTLLSTRSRWLCRLLRGHSRHGSHGTPLEDPRAHARHQRRPRRRDAVGGPCGRPCERDRRSACRPAAGSAHLQPRAPALVQRGAPRLPGAAASRGPRCRIRDSSCGPRRRPCRSRRLPEQPTSPAIFRS